MIIFVYLEWFQEVGWEIFQEVRTSSFFLAFPLKTEQQIGVKMSRRPYNQT